MCTTKIICHTLTVQKYSYATSIQKYSWLCHANCFADSQCVRVVRFPESLLGFLKFLPCHLTSRGPFWRCFPTVLSRWKMHVHGNKIHQNISVLPKACISTSENISEACTLAAQSTYRPKNEKQAVQAIARAERVPSFHGT